MIQFNYHYKVENAGMILKDQILKLNVNRLSIGLTCDSFVRTHSGTCPASRSPQLKRVSRWSGAGHVPHYKTP